MTLANRSGLLLLAGTSLAVGSCSSDRATAPKRAPIATLAVAPVGASLMVGATQQLTATPRDAAGTVLTDRTVTWSTANTAVASVSPNGLVTAVGAGIALVTATAEGQSASASITVLAPVAAVTLSSSTATLAIGGSTQLTATPRDAGGQALSGRTIAWSTSAPGVATVTTTGFVNAVGIGSATITASSEGRSTTATITVVASDADAAVVDAAWTQVVQRDGNGGSIPMVTGGGPAVLNVVYQRTSSTVAPLSQLVLRLTTTTGAVVYADTINAAAAPATASLELPSVQFLVPAAQIQPGRRWQVLRDPRGVAPDVNATNDAFPAAGPAALNTIAVAPLRVRFVPIVLTSHANSTGNVTSGNLSGYLPVLRAVHPLGTLETTIGTTFTTAASFGTAPSGGSASFWTQVLGELDLARIADPSAPDTYWYGVVRPPTGFTFTSFGGYGYIPSNPRSTGAGTRTALGVQTGWFNNPTQAIELVAHELGHNMGRRHSPCNNPAGIDPAFPLPDGRVGTFGHDVYSWATGAATSAVPIDATRGDLMGYCVPQWVHPYTYEGLLAARSVSSAPPAASRVSVERMQTLAVRGVLEDGRLTLPPAFTLTSRSTPDEGEVLVELLDAQGAVLLARRATLSQVDHSDALLFLAAIPITDDVEARLAGLRVSTPGAATVTVLRGAEARPAADVAVATEAAGTAYVCEDAAARAIAVFDAATGAMLGTATGPRITLTTRPATARVSCSDGLRSIDAIVR